MLTIWGRKTSSNVQAVMWCVGELGLPYERIDAGHVHGVVDTPEYLAMNPNGTVPTLRDGRNPPVWETGAILRYLAGTHAPDRFWPKDAIDRANVDQWAEWSKLNIAMNFTALVFWRVVRTAPSKQDPAAIRRAIRDLTGFFDIAERRLCRQPWLAGSDFTLADIQFEHCLYRYHNIEIERPPHPALRSYYDALAERPPFREHVMVSYEELRVTD